MTGADVYHMCWHAEAVRKAVAVGFNCENSSAAASRHQRKKMCISTRTTRTSNRLDRQADNEEGMMSWQPVHDTPLLHLALPSWFPPIMGKSRQHPWGLCPAHCTAASICSPIMCQTVPAHVITYAHRLWAGRNTPDRALHIPPWQLQGFWAGLILFTGLIYFLYSTADAQVLAENGSIPRTAAFARCCMGKQLLW